MLAQMEKVQLKANNIVCNSMLSTCAQSRQWQLALWLLSSFPKADVVSFNSTISACRGRTSIAMELLAAMEGRALQPSLVTLNSSICACSASDWPLALELLWQTKEVTSQRADDVTFSAVMSTCDRGSHWPRALEIFKVAPQEAVTSAAAISACAQGAEWELALELLERCSFTGSSGAAIVSAINACARGGQCVWAVHLLSHYRSDATLGAALHACANAGAWANALEILQQAGSWALRPDVAAMSSACAAQKFWIWPLRLLEDATGAGKLAGACVAAEACEKLAEPQLETESTPPGLLRLVEQRHPETRLELNVYQCNLAISECVKGTRWQTAVELLSSSPRQAVRRDTVSFNSALSRCPWRQSLNLFVLLGQNALKPDAAGNERPWRVGAMSALHRQSQWQKAADVYCSIALLRLRPETFISHAWPEALQMAMSGGGLDGTAFALLAEGAGLWPRAMGLLQLLSQSGAETSVVTQSSAAWTQNFVEI
ncbi:unnamed protein product [Durusdinium trenchii]|uniref:Pentatricopeptide repeat-containing protein, chloroplastic n=1 Tax=Durusdinium trenchii TaxID=1381693 RepID=A0ABP0LSH0_9DINO